MGFLKDIDDVLGAITKPFGDVARELWSEKPKENKKMAMIQCKKCRFIYPATDRFCIRCAEIKYEQYKSNM